MDSCKSSKEGVALWSIRNSPLLSFDIWNPFMTSTGAPFDGIVKPYYLLHFYTLGLPEPCHCQSSMAETWEGLHQSLLSHCTRRQPCTNASGSAGAYDFSFRLGPIPRTPYPMPHILPKTTVRGWERNGGRPKGIPRASWRAFRGNEDASYHFIKPARSSSHFTCLERQSRYAQVNACIISPAKVIH